MAASAAKNAFTLRGGVLKESRQRQTHNRE